ncbi:MAG: hypothetical protein CMC76_09845 [Flavobacteriaceae bacterium]|nr:hypothetical protein [Flavobacteriaceae bacterium]|tara:strand:+ start:189 stop:527 length:339 start_codon:yes stop_codon:yes gene_type:complete
MLTEQEMLEIAEKFLKKLESQGSVELMLYEEPIKKTYGNIYHFNSKKFILTQEMDHALGGNAPFLVEKESGRVVGFGTAVKFEDYVNAYENSTLVPTLHTYWYPDEDRFSHK